MNGEFQRGDAVRLRLYGGEVRAEVCALLGVRASVRITEAPHRPRLVGTDWCIYHRRLTRVLDSGELFPLDSRLRGNDDLDGLDRASGPRAHDRDAGLVITT